jgi:branched-subunit amino acid transport protein
MRAAHLTLGLTILGMGVVTYAIRVSFIMLLGRVAVRPLIHRALRFVPPAVLSTIIFPELFQPAGTFDFSLGNARLAAGALAALVVWRTKNVFLAIAVGMLALWILQAMLPH